MEISFYKAHPAHYFIGKKARLIKDVNSYHGIILAGTTVILENKRSGFTIITKKCDSCNIRMRVFKVNPEKLDLIEDAD